MTRRRLTFQLTPLLDLLLIVIFAQYMDIRETTTEVEDRIRAAAAAEVAQADAARQLLAAQLVGVERDREAFRKELETRLQDLSEELKLALANRQDVAQLMATLFKIPPETVEKVFGQEERSPEERQQLRELMQKLADSRTNEAIKHLLTHRAMRKRVDVWELFVDENGVAHLSTGEQQHTFKYRDTQKEEAARLAGLPVGQQIGKLAEFEDRAAREFAQQVFTIYQKSPQPKNVVVLLFSWRKADRHWRKPALEGLDAALRLMHGNNDGTQFVPAVLGLEVQS